MSKADPLNKDQMSLAIIKELYDADKGVVQGRIRVAPREMEAVMNTINDTLAGFNQMTKPMVSRLPQVDDDGFRTIEVSRFQIPTYQKPAFEKKLEEALELPEQVAQKRAEDLARQKG